MHQYDIFKLGNISLETGLPEPFLSSGLCELVSDVLEFGFVRYFHQNSR